MGLGLDRDRIISVLRGDERIKQEFTQAESPSPRSRSVLPYNNYLIEFKPTRYPNINTQLVIS